MQKFLFRVLCLLLLVSCSPAEHKRISAVKGVWVADALASQQLIFELGGEWSFLNHHLLPPADFQKLAMEGVYASQLSWLNRSEGVYGQGTYGLELHKLQRARYALIIPSIGSAFRAYILRLRDGQIIAQAEQGTIDEKAKSSIAAIEPRTLIFEAPATDDYLILIQVVNDSIRHGGLWSKPQLGREELVAAQSRNDLVLTLFVILTCGVMGLYSLSLYLRRREDSSNLWLAIFCFSFSFVRYAFTPDTVIFNWNDFTSFDFRVWMMIRYSNLTIVPLFSFLFMQRAFPEFSWRRTEPFLIGINVLLSMLFCVIDSRLITQNMLYFQINSLILIAIQVEIVVRATLAGDRAARMSCIGYIIVFCGVLFDVVTATLGADYIQIFYYSVVVCLYLQTQVTGIRFAEAFRRAAHLSSSLQSEVERQTRDIKSILMSIRQGIFSIRATDKCSDEQISSHLQELLRTKDLQGKTIRELILKQSNLSEDSKNQIEAALDACLGENMLAFELNEGSFINEIQLQWEPNEKLRILEIDWAPVLGNDQKIEKILVSLRDVTELRELERGAQEKDQDLMMMLELLNIPEDRFHRFLKNTKQFIDENYQLIQESSFLRPDVLKRLFVNMHTIKGSARTYMLKFLSDQAHLVEQNYVNILQGDTAWNRDFLVNDLTQIDAVIVRYQQLASEKLGWNLDQLEIRLPKNAVEQSINLLSRIAPDNLSPLECRDLNEAQGILIEHCSSRLSMVVDELKSGLQSMARDLGKEMPNIVIDEGNIWLYDRASNILHSCFVHMFRNSLDHGIEKSEERLRRGKPARGEITLKVSLVANELIILFKDDGRGLNLEKIKDLGVKRGLLDESVSDVQELAQLILCPGFSTKSEVSEISGRGMGMESAQTFLEENGGHLILVLGSTHDRQSAPFAIKITLPKLFCLELENSLIEENIGKPA